MNHINVTINGRQYRMACEEGQEVQLLKLAESLESRIGTLRGKFGEIGDARLIVMAALTVCDEMLDAAQRIRGLEQELESLRNVRTVAAERARATQAAIDPPPVPGSGQPARSRHGRLRGGAQPRFPAHRAPSSAAARQRRYRPRLAPRSRNRWWNDRSC